MDFEHDYVQLVQTIKSAPERQTRNAVTRSSFGHTLVIDELVYGIFPILQGRKMFWKGVVGELAAFLTGPESVQDFEAQGCNYWKQWGDVDGALRVDYGNAWLDFNGVNQLNALIDGLRRDPYGRRHIITGWNPANLSVLSLPCCHYSYQWYVTTDGMLDMIWTQRSADLMIGVPSDIILAAVFNLLVAQTVDLEPGRLVMNFGDTHIYESHLRTECTNGTYAYPVDEYLLQYSAMPSAVPGWTLAPEATVFNFTPDMFDIVDYFAHDPIIFRLEA